MSNRPAIVTQGEASKLFKAARAAGFDRARIIRHLDGKIELIAETIDAAPLPDALEEWRAANGAG